MAQRPIRGKIEPVAFAANVTKTREIPNGLYRGLSLNMVLNCTFDTCTLLTIDTMIAMIQNLDLTVNGNNSVFKTPLNYWYLMNYIRNQGVLSYDITKTDGTRDIYLQIDIPFTVPGAYKEEDTMLDIRNASTAVLKIDFGSPVAGMTVNSGNVYINTDEYIIKDEVLTVGTKEIDYLQQPIERTGKTRVKLPCGFDLNYYRIVLEVFDSAGARSNAELSEISLVSGSTVFQVMEASRLQQQNIVKNKIAAASWITGTYELDMTRGGRMKQILGTSDIRNQLDLILDAAVADGTANIYLERIGRDMDTQLGIIKTVQAAQVK